MRRTFRWDFVVADVRSAILGADFLQHYGLLVDLRHGRLVDPHTAESTQGESQSAYIHSVASVARSRVPQGDLGTRISCLLAEFAVLATRTTAAALLDGSSVHHRICTTGPPVFERSRRLYGERLTAAKQQFDVHLSRGVARPSFCEWASPLHMVSKHPAGYVRKTAVMTPFELFEFVGMPLGLRNSSKTFQRFMDNSSPRCARPAFPSIWRNVCSARTRWNF